MCECGVHDDGDPNDTASGGQDTGWPTKLPTMSWALMVNETLTLRKLERCCGGPADGGNGVGAMTYTRGGCAGTEEC